MIFPEIFIFFPGHRQALSRGWRLFRPEECVRDRQRQGRRPAELLPGRDAQVPLPALLRRRPPAPRPMGAQHRGPPPANQGQEPRLQGHQLMRDPSPWKISHTSLFRIIKWKDTS